MAVSSTLVLPSPVAAQVIRGTVMRPDRTPIPDATVQLRSADGLVTAAALADSSGAFVLRPAEGGTMKLEASHIGYSDFETADFDLADDAELTVIVRLDVAAIPLEELRVEAVRARNRRFLADFDRRREIQAFGGHFLDVEDIERRPMSRPSNLVLEAPGMTVVGGRDAFDLYTIMSGDCAANVYVDGMRINQLETSVDQYLELERIAGVEIYPRGLSAPPQYQDALRGECGTVLYWTKELEPDRPGGWSATKVALGVGAFAGLLIIGWAR